MPRRPEGWGSTSQDDMVRCGPGGGGLSSGGPQRSRPGFALSPSWSPQSSLYKVWACLSALCPCRVSSFPFVRVGPQFRSQFWLSKAKRGMNWQDNFCLQSPREPGALESSGRPKSRHPPVAGTGGWGGTAQCHLLRFFSGEGMSEGHLKDTYLLLAS